MEDLIIQNNKDIKQFIKLVLDTGTTMLKNGAEVYRVEDTMNRICNSRKNITNADSFVTNTGIFITLEFQGEIFTYLRRVKEISINLNKIHMVNEFSRKFVTTDMPIDKGLLIIKEINNTKDYSTKLKILSGSTLSGFFSLMFGGNINDFFASFIVGILVLFILYRLSKFNLTFFINTFIGAFLASFLSLITFKLNIGHNLNVIIIGAIMCLVPGVSITNSIRDTISGDSLAGISKGIEAILSALAIAFGVGIVLNLYTKGLI